MLRTRADLSFTYSQILTLRTHFAKTAPNERCFYGHTNMNERTYLLVGMKIFTGVRILTGNWLGIYVANQVLRWEFTNSNQWLQWRRNAPETLSPVAVNGGGPRCFRKYLRGGFGQASQYTPWYATHSTQKKERQRSAHRKFIASGREQRRRQPQSAEYTQVVPNDP